MSVVFLPATICLIAARLTTSSGRVFTVKWTALKAGAAVLAVAVFRLPFFQSAIEQSGIGSVAKIVKRKIRACGKQAAHIVIDNYL